MLTELDISNLDNIQMAMDVVIRGQNELGLDYIDIANYMISRGFSTRVINTCFSVHSGYNVNVCGSMV